MDLRLLLIIVSLSLAPLLAQAAAIPSYFVDFDLATETHDDLYTARRKLELDAVLRRTNLPRYDPPDVAGRVILGVRRPEFVGAPLKWIMIRVRIGAETTLAVAHDDLNLFGFKNGAGKWYIADGGYKGLPGSSTALPFGLNYGELLGFPGGHELLCTVPLVNQSAVEAVRTPAGYSPAATADEQVKQAFVRFVC